MTRPTTLYGWSLTAFQEDHHVITSSYFLILVTLLLACLTIQYKAEQSTWFSFVPSAGVHILVGMAISGIIRLAGGYQMSTSHAFDAELLGFSPSIFYFGFLPLIIFESGYHLKRQLFFGNIFPIILLAFVGTCISIIVVSSGIRLISHYQILGFRSPLSYIECICFGALISSTDPVSTLAVFSALRVDPTLHYLVLGESLLNDAIAITVFTVASRFVGSSLSSQIIVDCAVRSSLSFVVSCLLGYLCGIMFAYFYKILPAHSNSVFIVTSFMCIVYFPFFLSETFQLSGIVTVLFAGVSVRRYVNKNLSVTDKMVSSFVLKVFAHVADVSCFCLLGMSVFSQSADNFSGKLILWTLILITLGRALNVYPLLTLVNIMRSNTRQCFMCPFARRVNRWKEQISSLTLFDKVSQRNAPADIGVELGLLTKVPLGNHNTDTTHAPSFIPLEAPAMNELHIGVPLRPVLRSSSSCSSIGTFESVACAFPSSPRERSPLEAPYCPPTEGTSFDAPLCESVVTPPSSCSDTSTYCLNTMHMVFLSGLRGAVSFACAEIFPDDNGNRNLVISTTTALIIFTVLFQASWNPLFIRCLGIRSNITADQYLGELKAKAKAKNEANKAQQFHASTRFN